MNANAHAATHALVRHGVDAYANALSRAGGKELEAVMRLADPNALCVAIYASPPYELLVPPLPVSRLCVNLTRARLVGGVDGERAQIYEALRYSMYLVPAGVQMAWRKDSPSRHLTIYFHPDALDCTVDGGAVFDQQRPVFNAQITGTRSLTDQLAAELASLELLAIEAADSLAWLLLVRLARQLHHPGTTASNPLSPKALARLREYVVGNLSERILVADLARESGLSEHRFAQAFSDHTGQSPHQFVIGLRLDRAAQLLRGSSLRLVEVAHECGFANQQHLSNAMRRHFGTTPSRYRRMHKSGLC